VEIKGLTMGTSYTIKIVNNKDWNRIELKTSIDSVLREVNRQMSTYIPTSEISIFNRSEIGMKTPISSGFAEVLNRAQYWHNLTEGALNITVMPLLELWGFAPESSAQKTWEPPEKTKINQILKSVNMNGFEMGHGFLRKNNSLIKMDLGSIAKGWGVDIVSKFIQESGAIDFMVEIGGEIRTKGKNHAGQEWAIGIDQPENGNIPGKIINSVVPISDKALATSGNYRNYFKFDNRIYAHIIDPRTGYPIESDIVSVTVVGPTCTDADALATALMVLELKKGLNLIESLDGFEAYWIMHNYEGFETVRSSAMKINIIQ